MLLWGLCTKRNFVSLLGKEVSTRLYSTRECSNIRLNFHEEIEESINSQIVEELSAAYAYFSMASVFERDDIALPGFHKLFNKFADEEVGHAKSWVRYLNLRGGRAVFNKPIQPSTASNLSPLEATERALEMERAMTLSLQKLHKLTEKHGDVHSSKFVEDNFLNEQFEALKELGDLKTQLERVGCGMGLYLLDSNISRKCTT